MKNLETEVEIAKIGHRHGLIIALIGVLGILLGGLVQGYFGTVSKRDEILDLKDQMAGLKNQLRERSLELKEKEIVLSQRARQLSELESLLSDMKGDIEALKVSNSTLAAKLKERDSEIVRLQGDARDRLKPKSRLIAKGYKATGESFIDAVTHNDLEAVELFIEAKVSPQAGGALRLAAQKGYSDIVASLVEAGAVLNPTDKIFHLTVSESASQKNSPEVRAQFRAVSLSLLKAGANANSVFIEEREIERGIYNPEKIKVNAEFFPLVVAAEAGDMELAVALLESGADANRTVEFYRRGDVRTVTAFDIAVEGLKTEMVSLLLAHNVNIEGHSASPHYLCYVARRGQFELVRLLVEAGSTRGSCTDEEIAAGPRGFAARYLGESLIPTAVGAEIVAYLEREFDND